MSAKQHSAAVDVDAAIDRLYQAPLDQFTAQRNALASELRKSGDREEADRVKALPKPGATAWAVNQAWWRDQPTFRAMLDAGARLRAAHMERAEGKPADVRAAVEARQRAVGAVVEAAIEALGGEGQVTADTRHRIAGTVEALASSGVPPDVTVGQLSKDLQSSGLEALSAMAGLVPASPGPSKAPPRPVIVSRSAPAPTTPTKGQDKDAKAEAAARAQAAKIADAQTQLTAREEALREAESEAAASAKAEETARASLEAASARVTDLEQQLDAAREDERSARRALNQATKTASEAELIRARTMRDVKAAREQLDELENAHRPAHD
jgi:hypothetical protein